jgi:hypothetical protein
MFLASTSPSSTLMLNCFTYYCCCCCCCFDLSPLQVLVDNLINVPGLNITFTDPEALVLTPESKSALSLVPYKPAAEVPFGAWDTPLATPAGQLVNTVPGDKNGVLRSPANDLPGGFGRAEHNNSKAFL